MRASRFNEEQIIGILREQEAGTAAAVVCRKHGISSATFYKWKAKYGGLDVSDARRLRALEDENRRLKKLLACVRRLVPAIAGPLWWRARERRLSGCTPWSALGEPIGKNGEHVLG